MTDPQGAVVPDTQIQIYRRGECAHVGRKPLGDGLVGVPVRGFRGALIRFLKMPEECRGELFDRERLWRPKP